MQQRTKQIRLFSYTHSYVYILLHLVPRCHPRTRCRYANLIWWICTKQRIVQYTQCSRGKLSEQIHTRTRTHLTTQALSFAKNLYKLRIVVLFIIVITAVRPQMSPLPLPSPRPTLNTLTQHIVEGPTTTMMMIKITRTWCNDINHCHTHTHNTRIDIDIEPQLSARHAFSLASH